MSNDGGGLSDELWDRIEKLLPTQTTDASRGLAGRKPKHRRIIFEAIAHVFGERITWRSLPKRFGSSSAVHARYVEWRRDGFFDRLIASGILAGSDFEHISWPASPAKGSGEDKSEKPDRPSAGKEAARKRERIRENILKAATIVFEESGGEDGGGFERTTVEAIARKANVSTRTFFRYFSSKSEAIYIDWRHFLEWYESAISERTGIDDLLILCLDTFAEEFAKFTASEINRDRIRRAYLSPHFATQRQAYLAEIRSMILRVAERKGLERGGDPINSLVVAAIVPAVIDTINVRFSRKRGSIPRQEFDGIVEEILQTISHVGDHALRHFSGTNRTPTNGLA